MNVVPFLAAGLIRLLHASLRVRHVHPEHLEQTPQYIVTFWHEHLLLMLHCRFRRPIVTMSSRSRDGEYMVRVYKQYGVDAVRGSSSKGGSSALRGIIREAKQGKNLGFTPDGPRGPRRELKDGVIHTARATGLPIVPVAFMSKKKSVCARGTGWWSPFRSHARSSSMAHRSTFHAMQTWKNGVRVSNVRSTSSRRAWK